MVNGRVRLVNENHVAFQANEDSFPVVNSPDLSLCSRRRLIFVCMAVADDKLGKSLDCWTSNVETRASQRRWLLRRRPFVSEQFPLDHTAIRIRLAEAETSDDISNAFLDEYTPACSASYPPTRGRARPPRTLDEPTLTTHIRRRDGTLDVDVTPWQLDRSFLVGVVVTIALDKTGTAPRARWPGLCAPHRRCHRRRQDPPRAERALQSSRCAPRSVCRPAAAPPPEEARHNPAFCDMTSSVIR